jgi:HNH endonuclease/AP2 domain
MLSIEMRVCFKKFVSRLGEVGKRFVKIRREGESMDSLERWRLKINIGRGIQVFVEDLDLLFVCKWSISRGYAHGNQRKLGGQSKLHRIIMERMVGRKLSRQETVDHINGDRKDNRRDNLRIATQSQNCANKKKLKSNTSGYKGVHLYRGKWKSSIRANGKQIYLGSFSTPEQAHEAYKAAAIKYYGEFARFE